MFKLSFTHFLYLLAFLPFSQVFLYLGPEWEFFSKWDDSENFQNNLIFNSTVTNEKWWEMMFLKGNNNVYEPVTNVFKYLVFMVSGKKLIPRVFKVFSTTVHLINSMILLPMNMRRFFQLINISKASQVHNVEKLKGIDVGETAIMLTSLLYAIHPVNVEVVGWSSAMGYLLAMFFMHWSFHFFVSYITKTSFFFETAPTSDVAKDEGKEVGEKDKESSKEEPKKALSMRQFWTKDLFFSMVCYSFAIFSKAPAIAMPIVHVCVWGMVYCNFDVKVLASRFSHSHGKSHAVGNVESKKRLEAGFIHFFIGFTLLQGLSLFMLMKANDRGVDQYTDTVYLNFPQRIVKTGVAMVQNLSHLLFPFYMQNLRPHYIVREHEMSLMNPVVDTNLLLLMMIPLTTFVFNRFDLLIAFFTFMACNVPTYGFVQHGIVTLSADRFEHMSMVVFLPITCTLLQTMVDLQKKKWAVNLCFACIYGLLLVNTMNMLNIWTNETMLYQYGIKADPSDWRAIDLLAEKLWNDNDTENARHYYSLSRYYLPDESSIKGMLAHAKLDFVLEDRAKGCQRYEDVHKELKSKNIINGMVLNNVAVCSAINDLSPVNKQASIQLLEQALTDCKLLGSRFETTEENLNKLMSHKEGEEFWGSLIF